MVIRPLVSVVDDDESIRESLPDLLQEFGFAVQTFASAEQFLTSDWLDKTQCLILDVAMPGMSGPDLFRELKRQKREIPVIFITAHESEATRQRLINQGAIACLFKPFDPNALVEALEKALPAN